MLAYHNVSIHFFNMLETLDINVSENGRGEAKYDFFVHVFFSVTVAHLLVGLTFYI